MSLSSVEVGELDDELAREWEGLADRVHASPFLRPGWVTAWCDAFAPGTLHVISLRANGRLRAVVPLIREGPVLSAPANAHTPEFSFLSENESDALELSEALFRLAPTRVDLSYVNAMERTDAAFSAGARQAGYRLIRKSLERSPYVPIEGDWETYERQLGARRRSDLRRRRRRLEEQAPVSVDVMDAAPNLDRVLEEGFRVEAAGWKGTRQTAIASSAHTRRFYTDVARWAADRGWLRLAFLRCGENALAFDYCLELDGVHYLVKTGYDPAYREFAPGMILRYEMLRRAFLIGLAHYEFLGDDEPWKLEWATDCRERLRVQAFAPSVPGLARWMWLAHGRPVAARARRLLRAMRSR